MNDRPSRNWESLSALARQAPAPQVDIAFTVQRAIRRLPAPAPPSVLDLLTAWTSTGWLRSCAAALCLLAGYAAYQGVENSDALQLALGFSL